uniref:Uncharacterized protein n=1 Tax=Setaria digitata TaxID=48799 RepID=A0A915Q1C0_9BILA
MAANGSISRIISLKKRKNGDEDEDEDEEEEGGREKKEVGRFDSIIAIAIVLDSNHLDSARPNSLATLS